MDARIGHQGGDGFVDCPRIDQRLVSLHVDDHVALEGGGDLGQSVGPCQMVGARQSDLSAESADSCRNAKIIGRDDDARHSLRSLDAPVHVLDHRAAVQIGERFSGEAGRGESSGDDGDSLQRRFIDR